MIRKPRIDIRNIHQYSSPRICKSLKVPLNRIQLIFAACFDDPSLIILLKKIAKPKFSSESDHCSQLDAFKTKLHVFQLNRFQFVRILIISV